MRDKLFLTGQVLPNYIENFFASRRLLPKAAMIFSYFSENKRSGGLDLFKAAADYTGVLKELLYDGFFLLLPLSRYKMLCILNFCFNDNNFSLQTGEFWLTKM